VRDAVVEGVNPLKERSQCVDCRAEKREDNRFTRREVSTELRACGERDNIVEAQLVECFPKEVPHVNDLFRGRGSGAGPSRGHRGRRERETLRGTMDGHFAAHEECYAKCSSLRVQGRQLTESAEYREILYQKQCGVEKCRGREIAEAKLD